MILMTPELLARKKAEMLTDTAYEGRWRSLTRAAGNALTETSREWLPTLAAMSLLTDDPKWAARAQVLLEAAISLPMTKITEDRGKPIGQEVFQVALALDWLRDRLSPTTLAATLVTLETWGKWPWPETNALRKASDWGVSAPWDNYHYEFLRTSWLAGLVLKNDTLLSVSRARWAAALAWLQEHQPSGVFVEGSNYGIGSLASILQAVCANQNAGGELVPDWCDQAFWWVLQITTPGMGGKAPFGDQASDYKAIHSDMDRMVALLMASLVTLPGVSRCWLDGIARNRVKRAQSFWFEYLYYPSHVAPSPYQLSQQLTRRDPAAGYFSSRSGWEKDAVQVQAVCGPTWSNHQDAAGGFLVVRGNDFLVGFAKQWSASGLQHGAEFVNCITVDGRGQDNMLDKTARVLQSTDTERYTLWQMEAGQAYDYSLTSSNRIKPLKSWRRTLLFLKPNILFVHDRVEKNNAASKVLWHLNSNPQTIIPFVQSPRFGHTVGQSCLMGDFDPAMTFTTLPLKLGASGATSSYRMDFSVAPNQPVDEFLVVLQFGPAGFTPLPVTKTANGARCGDDEFTIDAAGTVALVDHRISPREAALEALWAAMGEWQHGLGTDEETEIQGVVEAAQRLLTTVKPP